MFDAEVFKAFGRVFILTYLSDGCILTSYLNINHIKYGYYHVEQTDTGHQFKEGFRPTTSEQKQRIKSLLNIYEGPLNTNYLTKRELNSTAKADSALSKSWFDSKKSKISKKSIEQLKNNAVNYISHIRGASTHLHTFQTPHWSVFSLIPLYDVLTIHPACSWLPSASFPQKFF